MTVQVGEPEFSSTVPKNAVVEQTPTAKHKVLRGDTVTIRLSEGPQLFQVPHVSTLPAARHWSTTSPNSSRRI